MSLRSRLCVTCVFATVALFASCSSDEENKDQTGDAGGSGGAAEAGAGTGGGHEATDASVVCGTETCTTPIGSSFAQVSACCMSSGGCGLSWVGAPECLAPSQPGTPDNSCGSFVPPAGDTWQGCCGPSGCGALNPFMGCLPNSMLGRPDAACNYDPNNDCTSVFPVTCDGAEDCPNGQRCCARFDFNVGFVDFGCHDSCTALDGDAADPSWRELCHAGDTCENTVYTCRTSMFLPESLTRCFDMGTEASPDLNAGAGEINCGTQVCGTGEKCCVRAPHAPYCAPVADDCICRPADAAL